MAADKKTAEVQTAEVQKPADPMKELVSYHIPRMSGEDPTVWVAINGKAWQIPRGKTVQIPKPVADRLDAVQRLRDEAAEYAENQQKKGEEPAGKM